MEPLPDRCGQVNTCQSFQLQSFQLICTGGNIVLCYIASIEYQYKASSFIVFYGKKRENEDESKHHLL